MASLLWRQEKPSWLHDIFILLFLLAPLGVGVFIYLWPHLHIIKLAYDFQELQSQEKILLQENEQLHTEKAMLRSLKRVERIAKQKLGFVVPQSDQIILVMQRGAEHAGRFAE